MRNVLEHEQKKLQDKFVGTGVVVEIPILYAGAVLVPINGDDLVRTWEMGFQEIYVYTKEKRVKDKKAKFKDLPKVKIKGI